MGCLCETNTDYTDDTDVGCVEDATLAMNP